MEKFNWIKKFYELRKESSNWISVSGLIPNDFDNYFLIHWNVGIVDDFPFEEYPERNETIEETNLRIKIDRKYGLFLNPEENKLFRQTTLKEIAKRFNLEYDYKIMNRIKETPAIKILEGNSIKNLKSAIENISEQEKMNLFVEDIYRYPIDEKPKQEFNDITIEDYFKWQEDFYFDYCTYLFPDNKKWCITTSEDLPMFLCTKREISKHVKNVFNMELFKVEYDEELYK